MQNSRSTQDLLLRDVVEDDLPLFFDFQLDPGANRMAAFTARDPTDREAFTAHWHKIMADPELIQKTIVWGGQVVGSIGSYQESGKPEVTYWIGTAYWVRASQRRRSKRFWRRSTPCARYTPASPKTISAHAGSWRSADSRSLASRRGMPMRAAKRSRNCFSSYTRTRGTERANGGAPSNYRMHRSRRNRCSSTLAVSARRPGDAGVRPLYGKTSECDR